MDEAGTVRPWMGHQERDHLGRTGSDSCFHGIAAVSVRPKGQGPWRVVLANYVNNVILAVDGKGQVTTLAGRPGVEGHQDGEAGKAIFNHPADVVAGLDGVVYVADMGNRCVRMIKDGVVSTLAGRPGMMGFQDGKGDQALFEWPKAIAQDPATGHLYVTDRNRVSRVTLAGEVTTLAGAKGVGFEDWLSGPPLPAGPGRLRDVPCLGGPGGLTVHRGKLYIADSWNHAVRVLDLSSFDLVTLAGDPEQNAFRPGPLRDGRPRDGERFAALGMPCHVAFDDQGHCLVAITHLMRGYAIAELSLAGVLPPEVPAGESKATLVPKE
jgi:sugar lactone lactonase YvrE